MLHHVLLRRCGSVCHAIYLHSLHSHSFLASSLSATITFPLWKVRFLLYNLYIQGTSTQMQVDEVIWWPQDNWFRSRLPCNCWNINVWPHHSCKFDITYVRCQGIEHVILHHVLYQIHIYITSGLVGHPRQLASIHDQMLPHWWLRRCGSLRHAILSLQWNGPPHMFV